jgi:hypothetical protein
MNQDREKQLVAEARKIASNADSWITLSNAVCDPHGGLIARYFPDPAQREEFLGSREYEQVNELLRGTIARTGLTPRQPGARIRWLIDRRQTNGSSSNLLPAQ